MPAVARSIHAQRVPGDIIIDRVLRNPYVAKTIANPRFNRQYDVPYGAGPNKTKDGVVNLDKHVPPRDVINGRTYDPGKPTAIHEIVEQHIADALEEGPPETRDQIYEMAHHAAERAERKWIEANLGPRAWDQYQAHWAQWLAPIEHANPANPPPDLDKFPYPHRNVHDAPQTQETEPVFARAERRIGVNPTPEPIKSYQEGGPVEEEETPDAEDEQALQQEMQQEDAQDERALAGDQEVEAPTEIPTSGTGADVGIPEGYEPVAAAAVPEGYEQITDPEVLKRLRVPEGFEEVADPETVKRVRAAPNMKAESAGGTALRETVHEAAPLAGGIATGALAGAALGSIFPGLGTTAGGLIGGVAGGVLGGTAVSAFQEWLLDKLGLSDAEQRRLNAEAHPYAALAPAALPALAFRPQNILKAGQRLPAIIGAGLGGGLEAAQEAVQGQPLDPLKIGTQAASMGIFSGRPTALGRPLVEPAAALGARFGGGGGGPPGGAVGAGPGGGGGPPPLPPPPGVTPAQQAAVRASLGEARATEPITAQTGMQEEFPLQREAMTPYAGRSTPGSENKGASTAATPPPNAGAEQSDTVATLATEKGETRDLGKEPSTKPGIAQPADGIPDDVRKALAGEPIEPGGTPPPPAEPAIPLPQVEVRPPTAAPEPAPPPPPPPAAAAATAPEFFVNKVTGKKLWQIVDGDGNNVGKQIPNEKTANRQADKWKANPEVAPEGKAPRGPRAPAVYKNLSLLQFIASNGGIKAGENRVEDVRRIVGRKNFVPGFGAIIRKEGEGGLSLSEHHQRAVEGQYIDDPGFWSDRKFTTDENTLLDHIDRAARGEKILPAGEAAKPAGPSGRDLEEQQALSEARDAVRKGLREVEFQGEPPPEELERAARLVASKEMDPVDAYERAVEELDQERKLFSPDDRGYIDFEDLDNVAERGRAYPEGKPPAGAGEERARPGAEEALPPVGEPARPAREAGPAPRTEQTPAGEQGVLPGAERISDAELAQRRADERLKPTADQRPADEGLFGEPGKQRDIEDKQAATRARIEEVAARHGGLDAATQALMRRLEERAVQIERGTIPERELPPERMGRVQMEGMARGPRRPMPPGAAGGPPPPPPSPPGRRMPPGAKPPLRKGPVPPPGSPQATVRSRIAQPQGWQKPTMEGVKNTWNAFYTAAKDALDPIKVVAKAMAEGRKLSVDEDPHAVAQMTRGGSWGLVEHFVKKGTIDYKTKNLNGKSLDEVMKPVGEDVDNFVDYLVAKRAIEAEKQGYKTGVDMPAANQTVAQGAARFEPHARELYGYQDRLLKYLRDSGAISQKAYDAMSTKNNAYVPFYRLLDPKGQLAQDLGVGPGLRVRDPIHGMKGSDLQIINPLDSIVKNTALFVHMAEKNRAMRVLRDLALKSPVGSQFMERQKPTVHPIEVTPEELNRFLKQQGIAGNVADGMTVFRPNAFRPSREEIAVYIDGKPEIYKVPEPLGEAINSLDTKGLDLFTKIIAAPARLLRAGATLAPEFMIRNPVRDQFSAVAFSKYGYVPIYDMVRGLGNLLGKSDRYWDWMKSGGANATLVSLDRNYISQQVVGPRGLAQNVKNVITSPIDALRTMSELMENSTRLGLFMRARGKGATLGEAGFESREGTLDFQRIGAKTRALNAIIPFFNAQVEGVDRAARAFKDSPGMFLAKVGMSITLPSVLLWLSNKDDPRWRELPEWQKDFFWIIPTNKWVPMTAADAGKIGAAYKRQLPNGQWERNDGTIWRIPKPFELGVLFGSVPERALDAFFTDNPNAWKDLGKSVGQAMLPGFMPQAFAPIIEQFANRSFFLDRPLVPKYLEGLQPKYQAAPYTSDTAKTIGGLIDGLNKATGKLLPSSLSSPIMVDNYIRQWSGGLGAHVTSLLDKGLQASGIAPAKVDPTPTMADMPLVKAFVARFPSASVQSVQDFYNTYDERKKAATTAKFLEKSDPEAAKEMRKNEVLPNAEDVHKALGTGFKAVRDIYANPKISAEDKRTMIDVTYLQMIEIAKRGNATFERTKKKEYAQ